MGLKPTKAQTLAIDSLIEGTKRTDDLHKSTLAVLHREGWVKDGHVTPEGVQHTTLPTIPANIVTFGKAVPYSRGVIPKGTQMLVQFVNRIRGIKNRKLITGVINTKEGAITLKVYYQTHMTFSEVLMPDMEAIRGIQS